ncbi:MAG: ABC transporter ATP-binding protein [Nocardioidaceae bacterium]
MHAVQEADSPSTRPELVAFDEVAVRYRGGVTVGPISFKLSAGRVLGLVGENGAGKTTILRLLCGLVVPRAGAVTVRGERVNAGHVPADLGALIEEPPFFGWATGRQHLLLAASAQPGCRPRVAELLDLVGLAARGDDVVASYSQGMRQRLGIARAMLHDPQVLVLDEPSNGLDPRGVSWLRGMLRQRANDGKAVIVSSHLLAEMQLVADQVILLAGGQVLGVVDVSQLSTRPGALEEAYFEMLSTAAAPDMA